MGVDYTGVGPRPISDTLDYTTQARYTRDRQQYLADRGGVVATTVVNAPPAIKGPFTGMASGGGAIERGNAPVYVPGLSDAAGFIKMGPPGLPGGALVWYAILAAVAMLVLLLVLR